MRLPIEEVGSLGRDFDLIISTGVLYHMADPLAGMTALGKCLRLEGVAVVMLYAKYSRVGVEIMQSLFRLLGLGQDEPALALVKETLGLLRPDHPVQPYRTMAKDLNFDGGIVDTFLHGRDRSYSVPDCLRFVSDAGLVFQAWLDTVRYYPDAYIPENTELSRAINKLPEPEIWAATEMFQTLSGGHLFCACRPDRPPARYAIDFQSDRFLDCTPAMFSDATLERPADATPPVLAISRGGLGGRLSEAQSLIAALTAEGKRTVRQILEEAKVRGLAGDAEGFVRRVFVSFWRLGFVQIRLP